MLNGCLARFFVQKYFYLNRNKMKFSEFTKKKPWYSSFWADIAYAFLGGLVLFFIFETQYAAGEFGFSAKIEKKQIKPSNPVIVSFDLPLSSSEIFQSGYSSLASNVEKNLEIFPPTKVNFIWKENFRKLEIRPERFFEPGKEYQVKINPQTSYSLSKLLKRNVSPLILSFQVETAPRVISINPISGDPNVKIDSLIKISFDKSTAGYDVNFAVEPSGSFDLSYDSEKKNFTLSPKAKFDYARDYVVSVRLAPAAAKVSAEDMPEVFRANFKTEPSPPPPLSVEEVVLPEKNKTSEVPADQVASPEAKIKEGKYIDINLSKQQLSIFENGERLGTYKVSTGKRGMATPTGTFQVIAKRGRAWSRKYNLYMPYFMQFTRAGHGIHELPEWKNGYKEGANHLGIPVSHGCVRLGVGPAAKVYNWADIGTPIVIHY